MENKLYLLYKYNNLKELESDIEKALGRWSKRPELKDHLPEVILFHPELSEKITEEYILTLEVKFKQTVQSGHFMIEGVKYK